MTTTELREKTEEAVATEMNVASALVHFDEVLTGLHLNRRNEPANDVTVPVSMLKEMATFLLDYRRALETSYGALPMMHFRSIAERNRALDAYQNVCQRATALLCQVEAAAQ